MDKDQDRYDYDYGDDDDHPNWVIALAIVTVIFSVMALGWALL